METYFFRYSDGKTLHKDFSSLREASWFAHNEGDHLMDWGPVKKVSE
jgi:hypothetical protein